MKKVIVTGANGFIGSSLIKALLAKGVRIVAVDISFATPRLPDSEHITKIETDINDTLINKIPADTYDAFYHLAWRGVNGAEKADPLIQLSNIRMALNCADICKKLSIKKLLCAGTVAENALMSLPNLERVNGGMIYGVAKHNCRLLLEAYCKNIGLPFTWMQFSNIYGEGNVTGNLVSYTLGEILNGREATFGPALQPYDFIHIDDLIEAVCRLGDCASTKTFYYIGSGSSRILREFLQLIGEIARRPESIKIGMRADDGIKYSTQMFNNADLVSAIGNYVNVTFDEGLKRTIEWYKKHFDLF